MQIVYSNTFLDLLKFNVAHQFRSIPLQSIHAGLGAAFALLLSSHGSMVAGVVAGVMVYAAAWVMQVVVLVLVLGSRRDDRVLTEHRLELSDAGIRVETRFSRSEYYWPGLLKVVERGGLLAIYVSQHQALIVPRRAFGSQLHYAQFMQTLRRGSQAASGDA